MKLSKIFKRNKYKILRVTQPEIDPMKILFIDHENNISKEYEFYGVPRDVREEFLADMGILDDYFKNNIKGKYECKKIDEK